ncbi:ABC transporter, partial [Agromyces tardus]
GTPTAAAAATAAAPYPAATEAGRPTLAGLLGRQVVHALVSYARSVLTLIFSFGMPLVWLWLIGLVAGNAVIDEQTGLRVMQFAAPTAIAMGCLFSAYPAVATSVGEAKERLVLKRLRGTPLPTLVYVLGQTVAASVVGAVSVLVTIGVARVFYDVRVPPESVGPMVVTILLALATFSTLGVAVAALAPSARAAEAISIGTAVSLAFISGIFIVGAGLPEWIERIADVFPLKPFVTTLQEQFNPYSTESGWDAAALAVIAAWGVGAAAVAVLAFRPVPGRPRRGRAAGVVREPPVDAMALRATVATPSAMRRVAAQGGAALRIMLRRPGDLFFAIVVPLGLFLLLITMQRDTPDLDVPTLVSTTAASMATWGVAVVAFMNVADWSARARETGVLKRLRGTPLDTLELGIGRGAASLVLSFAVCAVLLAVGAIAYGMRVTPAGAAVGALVVTMAVAAFIACALLLTALVSSARAVGALALVILFTLAFFSDVFLVGGPEWMSAVGRLFPLAHLRSGLVLAWHPDGTTMPWADLGVLAAWAAGAGLLTWLVSRRGRVRRTSAC